MVISGSGNGLLSDGIMPIPEPVDFLSMVSYVILSDNESNFYNV